MEIPLDVVVTRGIAYGGFIINMEAYLSEVMLALGMGKYQIIQPGREVVNLVFTMTILHGGRPMIILHMGMLHFYTIILVDQRFQSVKCFTALVVEDLDLFPILILMGICGDLIQKNS